MNYVWRMSRIRRAVYNSDLARAAYRTSIGRFLYHLPEEIRDLLGGKRHPMVPPRWRVFTGRGDFLAVGEEFVGYYKDLAGLKPSHAVLEIGCGMGRMAVALTGYLDASGRYDGLDIVPAGIRWCRKKISPRHPNFNFHLAAVRNDLYRRGDGRPAERYALPYENDSFDFVTLGSVFTHMAPEAIRNYLREIARVLKPGGKTLITWYVLDEENLRRVRAGDSRLAFTRQEGPWWSVSRKHPEHDTAYELDWIRKAYEDAGLSLDPDIRYGSWSGRASFLSTQDIVLARKGGD